MAEVPSVVYRIPEYAALGIDGVSIGSNDLTQLMLGVDRDSEICAELFDESDAAVLDAIERIIAAARDAGHHVVAVRAGTVEPARVRRAPRALRHHLDLGEPRRRRQGPTGHRRSRATRHARRGTEPAPVSEREPTAGGVSVSVKTDSGSALPAAVRETHVSTLFFVGDRVYKLKKPVKLDFLDFTTAAERERACRREVELNRRLAPDVYLGVAEVARDGRSAVRTPRRDATDARRRAASPPSSNGNSPSTTAFAKRRV